MIKKALFLTLLIGGVFVWYQWIWTHSDNEITQAKPVAANQSPQVSIDKGKSVETITDQDVAEAEQVAHKYIEVYFSAPRQSSIDLANQLKPYASATMLSEMEQSMKVPSQVKVTKMDLSRVTPAFLPGGITYHSIVSTDSQEVHYWFSMMKLDGKWLVVKEEEGMGGSDND